MKIIFITNTMEGFNYSDIFATKGIEYIVIIAFLILLVPFWILVNRKSSLKRDNHKTQGIVSSETLRILAGLFYSKNHTWMYMEKSGHIRVGLDDFLLHITGDILIKMHKNPGDLIHKGELLLEIHLDNRYLRILSPVSGFVMDLNPIVQNKPTLLNIDPYNKGWICEIKPSKWIVEADACFFGDAAKYWINSELIRFRDFLSVSVKNISSNPAAMIMQDGGELSEGSLCGFPLEIWTNFEMEFLNLHSF